MGLTFKEIVIDNWNTFLGLCVELIDIIMEIFTGFIPEIFSEIFLKVMLDLTYRLNIFGKILNWSTVGVMIFIFSIILILAGLCIAVLHIMIFISWVIIGIILYLPSILIRWIHQRTTKPFFRMVFVKKECKNNN